MDLIVDIFSPGVQRNIVPLLSGGRELSDTYAVATFQCYEMIMLYRSLLCLMNVTVSSFVELNRQDDYF